MRATVACVHFNYSDLLLTWGDPKHVVRWLMEVREDMSPRQKGTDALLNVSVRIDHIGNYHEVLQ